MLKKHLYVTRRWYCGPKFTIQQYGAHCHTAKSLNNYLNENVHDYIRKENSSPNSCDLNLLDYANLGHDKKDALKERKAIWRHQNGFLQQYQMHGIDWQKKHQYGTSNLTTLTHDSMYISIVIDMLFIKIKLNIIKWL